eukprot:1600709-Amphidinium_carterae.1
MSFVPLTTYASSPKVTHKFVFQPRGLNQYLQPTDLRLQELVLIADSQIVHMVHLQLINSTYDAETQLWCAWWT